MDPGDGGPSRKLYCYDRGLLKCDSKTKMEQYELPKQHYIANQTGLFEHVFLCVCVCVVIVCGTISRVCPCMRVYGNHDEGPCVRVSVYMGTMMGDFLGEEKWKNIQYILQWSVIDSYTGSHDHA